jgi:PAS domain S-box-containing protein
MATAPESRNPSFAERRLRGLIDSVADAIVSADEHSRIVSWNAAATRMFGWSGDEAIGRRLTMLMPERYRAGHLAGIARLSSTGRPKLVGGGPVELEGLRKDDTEFPIELTLGEWSGPEGTLYTGIIRDVSDRRELESYRRAQVSVAGGLAGASTVPEAATAVLQAIGEAVGWPLGALWLVGDDAVALHCVALWHSPAYPAPAFQRLSLQTPLERGSGLPGRVWERGEVVWIDDVLAEQNFPRVKAAADDGLHAAIGLPLVGEEGMIGVLEFFDHLNRHPTPAVMSLIGSLSEQVGQFLQRRRAEDQLAGVQKELARRRDSERHAQEINAHVINHLVQASEALDAGDTRRAQAEMHRTLEEASRIVTELGL